jgi:argininosuccinate lyase
MLQDKPEFVKNYLASVPFDSRLYREDIRGSIAHARMLEARGIVAKGEADTIVQGLKAIQEEIERGDFQFKADLEDIHLNIEARLFEKVGDVAGRLHTARSRNDQIALDMRLFLKKETEGTIRALKDLQSSLVRLASRNKDVIMPGYTHLQQAQPILFAHHILAYFEMFQRDIERFHGCLIRTDVSPLGSGALAGTGYPIDPKLVAQDLGFSRLAANSIDAVSDRDFVIEYEACAALTAMHLSRLAEEIILWASDEFRFVRVDEAFASGSSIMPQKRNPDVAELARGKTGRVYGNLMATLTTMKALPLAYNRDLQEDKERLFDTVDTLCSSLQVFAQMTETLKVDAKRTREAIRRDYILGTDLADYLVRKGLPFREAHGIISRLARHAIAKDRSFHELSLSEYRGFSPLFDEDVYAITLDSSVASRNTTGATSPEQVELALIKAKELVARTP